MEWHSFGTVAEPGKQGFSLVVSRAGDWTSRKIEDPPSEIWVRGIPTIGFIHVAPLFRRVVLVATGSGIGPCVPCILEQRVPIRLLWTSPNVRQTFGDELVDTILEKSPDAVVYGKPRLAMEDLPTNYISRHSGTWKAGHGQIDVPACSRVQSRGGLHYFESNTHSEGSLWYDEQGHSSVRSHLGFMKTKLC